MIMRASVLTARCHHVSGGRANSLQESAACDHLWLLFFHQGGVDEAAFPKPRTLMKKHPAFVVGVFRDIECIARCETFLCSQLELLSADSGAVFVNDGSFSAESLFGAVPGSRVLVLHNFRQISSSWLSYLGTQFPGPRRLSSENL